MNKAFKELYKYKIPNECAGECENCGENCTLKSRSKTAESKENYQFSIYDLLTKAKFGV